MAPTCRTGPAGRAVQRVLIAMVLLMSATIPTLAGDSEPVAWLQYGGPQQDFRAPSGGLATDWPEGGPERIWSRPLGAGYSAILAEGDRLYTMYRVGDMETVVCLDAATGDTVWERSYEHPPHPRHQHGYGAGPNSTPLIDGDLIFTVGVAGRMHALRKEDGGILWSRELWGEGLDGNLLSHGYSSSPVAYKDSVIVPVGGDGAGLVAFNRKDGSVKWKTQGFRNSFSSPRIVEILGEPQVMVFMAEELIGVNPDTGELRWRYPHGNQWEHNITLPIVVDGNTIFLSSPQAGARGLRLSAEGGTIEVEEIWATRRIQFYHGSSVRYGGWVYGSTGVSAVAYMAAINLRTGEIGWRERGFAKANCVGADGKLVILDENGVLALASATPGKLVVHARTQLLDRLAWTAPTIVGTTMYVRDNRRILAVDLGRHTGPRRPITEFAPAAAQLRRAGR